MATVAEILEREMRMEGRARAIWSCISREQILREVTHTLATPVTRPNSKHFIISFCTQTASTNTSYTLSVHFYVRFFSPKTFSTGRTSLLSTIMTVDGEHRLIII